MRLRRALAASVALHAAVLAALLMLPDRDPAPPPLSAYAEVELIELPAEPRPVPVPARARETTDEPPPTPASDPAQIGPTPAEAPGRKPARRRRHGPAGHGDPTTGSGEAPPGGASAPTVGSPSGDPAGALALSGLRSTRAGSTVPRLPAGIEIDVPDFDPDVARTPADAGFQRQRDGRLLYFDRDPGKTKWMAELLPDGRVHFTDLVIPGLGHSEWYVQPKKRLLTATAPMRTRMAVAFAKKNIDTQLAALTTQLRDIWLSDRPPHTRRALIFALWDECEESLAVDLGELGTPSKIDAIRQSAGTRAREKIIAFIRLHIPADGPDRYTEPELRSMNARRTSRERFDPYA